MKVVKFQRMCENAPDILCLCHTFRPCATFYVHGISCSCKLCSGFVLCRILAVMVFKSFTCTGFLDDAPDFLCTGFSVVCFFSGAGFSVNRSCEPAWQLPISITVILPNMGDAIKIGLPLVFLASGAASHPYYGQGR